MPIQPIDMQTLFAKINQVGKEQAALKSISAQHQSLQNSEIIKQADQKMHTVTETEDLEDGAAKTDEDGHNTREKEQVEEQEKEEEKLKDSREAETKKKEVVKDPDLGHHIDLSG